MESSWSYRTVVVEFGEVWKKNFRVRCEDILELVEMIRPYARERSKRARQDIIALEKRVAMTLHYLKDQGSIVMTANVFAYSISSTCNAVKEVCRILSKNVAPRMIKYPSSKAQVEKANREFLQKFGFPRVLGCIDGTHIPISQPHENPHDYFSYKMKYTINVQAICDCNGRFTDVDIKWPDSHHDARVFANSEVQKGYTKGKFKLYYKKLIPGDELIPQILLGDPAYPLLPYVMKEYAVCQGNNEVMFNTMLRPARNQIECAFGRLKARWRILLRPMDLKLEDIPDIILACFVLHNFCEERNIEPILADMDRVIIMECGNAPTKDIVYTYNTKDGGAIRAAITRYFAEYL